ncbi:sensor domain-containing diguanylate cyclase [Shewanella sp. D64]|uniref:sensor domain-containing diguanylate cyclase n=1 Tax=unclassified Shewanella TaxID=196818 RepID=UPI0022BA6F83|nr:MULTISPECIES: sensor domain-containing diguanylate cyclase [unclassified Shewanella]MEC4727306.1 sensor domain-containing diguanylate cyclase [Shewanella sp. D64]MEC4739461.1 sensor domain-containing diguanylate cyclase [Shewanella sp. E94]WBJ96790.1 sensor domain-containing diguanylate cyclase [Shewanella sp. MTB7]
MFTDLKITHKFPVVMICFALLSALITAFIAFTIAKNEMTHSAEDKLSSLLESRSTALNTYFSVIEKDLIFHAQSPLVISAVEHFSQAWIALDKDQTQKLQNSYIPMSPFSNEQKSALNASIYDQYHGDYHPAFTNLVSTREFHDLFLFNTQGELIYTVKKEEDFATNLITGRWNKTHLSELIQQINNQPHINKHLFADFSPYEPSNNAPASFIASPVFDSNRQYIGIIAFQMPIAPLNRVMHVTAGMGKSGETYLVGPDLLMRSDSRFFLGQSILKTQVDTVSVHRALVGEAGNARIEDYRGVSVFSAFAPVNFLGTRWAIIAEIDTNEILSPVYSMNRFLMLSGAIIAIVIFFLGYLLAADISLPLVAMTHMMTQLSRNDLNIDISGSERKDEVGNMAKAMKIFKHNAIERDQLQKKLKHMAHHDTLTGLPTREYAGKQMQDYLKTLQTKGNKLVVIFADLDNFKNINDTLGHQAGDQLLKEVTVRLSDAIRDEDILARVGGDEFLVILPHVSDLSIVEHIARTMIDSLTTDFVIQDTVCKVGVSLGIAVAPDDGVDGAKLINKADKAMYLAKHRGKNNFAFTNELNSLPNEKTQTG